MSTNSPTPAIWTRWRASPAIPRYHFERLDICDGAAVARAFARHRPDAVLHLAAESHVDRSIDEARAFVDTNVLGTYHLLEAARREWSAREPDAQARFRFQHVSTDEVYGSLGASGRFTEETPYRPNSPYAASKAASDHLVRAWHRTYGLPAVVTNCSNNYGPYQFPEKLIPTLILKAVAGEALPIYGTGRNVRDWLHVSDHAEALRLVLSAGRPGETYNIGGDCERANLEIAQAVCALLDELLPESPHRPHGSLITLVEDRPGHDMRYAVDCTKLRREHGWRPRHDLTSGLRATVGWYLDNAAWCARALVGPYGGERLGLGSDHAASRVGGG